MADPWQRATLAMRLLALDPGLGGLALRARAGPVRDTFQTRAFDCNATRLHPAMDDATLLGGLDLTATLAAGQLVQKRGLLQGNGPLILTMAERTPPGMAARIAQALDTGAGPLLALDEGAEPDEALPPALAERLAFCVDLRAVPLAAAVWPAPMPPPSATASHTQTDVTHIAQATAAFGIDSGRAATFALRAARAHARLHGRSHVEAADLEAACTLVLAHRATRIPEEPPQQEAPPPPENAETETDNGQSDDQLPSEVLLDAVRALVPDDLLDRLATQKARSGQGSGSGAARKGNRRGRPLPSRAGRGGDGARVDLIATLRAAAPWQTIRRRDTGRSGVQLRRADLHYRRFEEKSDRLLIFAVDASGSAALARLAEVKGAVELLLTQAYARRDHVALVGFRAQGAELLLPPTRSLVQTKKRLAALPGGGGTPLAAGLWQARAQAQQAARRGLTPTICLLTDGRANIARDGTPDRKQAAADASDIARILRAEGVAGLVIDSGKRPEQSLKQLALTLGAPYLPLPRADAQRLSGAVSAALGD